MTKGQFIAKLAEKTDKPKTEVIEFVDVVFDTITQTMLSGDSVNISGFGIFKVSDRKARMGRNPRTGEAIHIAAKKTPKFRPSKTLKETVM